MFKKLSMIGAALAMTAGMVVPTASAQAQYYGGRDGYSDGYRGGEYRDYREYRGDRVYRGDRRYYRDRNYRNYRGGYRCDRGTGGTIIGAIAGGLLGNAVVGRHGDRTAGTIVGAGVGALAGRSIDRSDSRNRC